MDKIETPQWETPTIVDHGEFTELTAANNHGSKLDFHFTTNTPLLVLTFSH